MVSNHKILVYGDISTHEMRYAIMKACRCKTDAISTNIPLCEHVQQLSHQIATQAYSIVVISETANQQPANCELVADLQKRHPHTRFILATAPGRWMHSPRYGKGGEDLKKANNQHCREYAANHGIPLMDVEQWMLQYCLTDVQAAAGIKTRLALSYLRQLRISKAWKCIKLKMQEKDIARYCNVFLAQKAGQYVKKLSRDKATSPETLWRNSWQQPGATALLIGDSNMRALCRANAHLSNEVDMYATSYPMLSAENQAYITKHLTKHLSHVIFSLGTHHLQAQSPDELRAELTKTLLLLKAQGRQVLALTTTDWALKDNLTVKDKEANELIHATNAELIAAAKACEVELLDLNQILATEPYSDYVHFSRESYIRPSYILEQWSKGKPLQELLSASASAADESC